MHTEVITLSEQRNVTLTVYLQEVAGEFRNVSRRPAVLILPGGGYQFCSSREADPVAAPYLAAGFHAFILRYSVKEYSVWPRPLEDFEQAMELIRSKSDEWSIYSDKVAVIGFSAGGHLAAAAATMAKNRPNAAILGYAVAGADVKLCNPSAPDTVSAVSLKTCPCFLFSTRTDGVVHIINSIRFMEALAEYGVAFESHIYAYGPHGFSTGDTSVQSAGSGLCPRANSWVADSIGWLRDMFGIYGADGLLPPVCRPYVNDNHEPFLSVDCTFAHLMGNPSAKALLDALMSQMQGAGSGFDTGGANTLMLIGKMPLREILAFTRVDNGAIEALNEQLGRIQNN